MVNDTQTLAHYSRILLAIRDAKQLGRLSDLLTDERISALMEIVPRKETGYWRHDLTGVRPKDRPFAFYSFVSWGPTLPHSDVNWKIRRSRSPPGRDHV